MLKTDRDSVAIRKAFDFMAKHQGIIDLGKVSQDMKVFDTSIPFEEKLLIACTVELQERFQKQVKRVVTEVTGVVEFDVVFEHNKR